MLLVQVAEHAGGFGRQAADDSTAERFLPNLVVTKMVGAGTARLLLEHLRGCATLEISLQDLFRAVLGRRGLRRRARAGNGKD